MRGNHHARNRVAPQVAPVVLARLVAVLVRQHAVPRVGAADARGARLRGGRVVRNAEVQGLVARRGGGDLVHVRHAQGRLDDKLKADPLLAALGHLDLRNQHVQGVDVRGDAALGNHHEVQALTGLLDDVNDVTVHEHRVKAVDAHGHGLLAPVDLVERLDDVLAGNLLLIRGHGVLEVQEDDVRRALDGLLEELRARGRDGKLRAIQARRARRRNGEARAHVTTGEGAARSRRPAGHSIDGLAEHGCWRLCGGDVPSEAG
mmetsp:Transcript_26213/g.78153  ORF Transcript_26213/g.78153 Transcript_26213/m.78153 type:complete len:261 (+) Transcript_26213:634-1416(+)